MTKMGMVRNDLKPTVEATLKMKDGTKVNLSGCSVKFHMKKADETIVDKAATIVDAENGLVKYEWQPGDTDVIGTCKAEFEVAFPDNTTLTFPTTGDFTIIFREEYA